MMAGTSFNVSARCMAPAIIRLVTRPVVDTPTPIALNRGASRSRIFRFRIAYNDEVPFLAVAGTRCASGGVDHTFDQVLRHRIGPQVTHRTAGFHRFDDIHGRLLLDSASLIFVATQQLLMSYASHHPFKLLDPIERSSLKLSK